MACVKGVQLEICGFKHFECLRENYSSAPSTLPAPSSGVMIQQRSGAQVPSSVLRNIFISFQWPCFLWIKICSCVVPFKWAGSSPYFATLEHVITYRHKSKQYSYFGFICDYFIDRIDFVSVSYSNGLERNN